MNKELRAYFKKIGKRGGKGCSDRKRAALEQNRQKKVLKLKSGSAS